MPLLVHGGEQDSSDPVGYWGCCYPPTTGAVPRQRPRGSTPRARATGTELGSDGRGATRRASARHVGNAPPMSRATRRRTLGGVVVFAALTFLGLGSTTCANDPTPPQGVDAGADVGDRCSLHIRALRTAKWCTVPTALAGRAPRTTATSVSAISMERTGARRSHVHETAGTTIEPSRTRPELRRSARRCPRSCTCPITASGSRRVCLLSPRRA